MMEEVSLGHDESPLRQPPEVTQAGDLVERVLARMSELEAALVREARIVEQISTEVARLEERTRTKLRDIDDVTAARLQKAVAESAATLRLEMLQEMASYEERLMGVVVEAREATVAREHLPQALADEVRCMRDMGDRVMMDTGLIKENAGSVMIAINERIGRIEDQLAADAHKTMDFSDAAIREPATAQFSPRDSTNGRFSPRPVLSGPQQAAAQAETLVQRVERLEALSTVAQAEIRTCQQQGQQLSGVPQPAGQVEARVRSGLEEVIGEPLALAHSVRKLESEMRGVLTLMSQSRPLRPYGGFVEQSKAMTPRATSHTRVAPRAALQASMLAATLVSSNVSSCPALAPACAGPTKSQGPTTVLTPMSRTPGFYATSSAGSSSGGARTNRWA